jgi:threonine/homoserine/homoserine lactone efflux protein
MIIGELDPILTITVQAVLLGLAAGLAPGPLLALVMAESLRGGAASGVRVALAPLVTDAPIVALSWGLVGSLDPRSPWLAALSAAGALLVAHVALGQWRATLPEPGAVALRRSLGRGVAVNLLSPHPWLFWMTVGGPLLAAAALESVESAVAFLLAFYALLIGTKVVLALLTGHWGARLTAAGYRLACRLLGVALALFAVQLGWDALSRLIAP